MKRLLSALFGKSCFVLAWSNSKLNEVKQFNMEDFLWANQLHIKSDCRNKTSCTIPILKSWFSRPYMGFSIFWLVALQFIYQVCWSKFREIHFKKRNSPRWFFRLVSWESFFKAICQVKYSINLFREATFTLKQSSDILLQKFCQHFTSLGDHVSSYVNTLKTIS